MFTLNRTFLAALSVALLAGCDRQQPTDPAPAPAPVTPTTAPAATRPATPPSTRPAATPSEWTPSDDPKVARFRDLRAPKPATWIEHPPSSNMRVANYTVPGRDGREAAHIVGFYFGRNMGGSIEMNIQRWQEQFRPDDEGNLIEPMVETVQAGDSTITLVELVGDWQKMGQDWFTKDQLFITAIVEHPDGNIFIRFAGDPITVDSNRAAFMEMIEGLRPAG